MVRIIDYRVRQNSMGESFNALIVQGIVLVKSKETSQFYATSKESSLPCTFSEDVCKKMIGHEIDGSIQRIDCDPYTVVNQNTGEEVLLNHRYQYIPEQRKQVFTSDEVIEVSELEELEV